MEDGFFKDTRIAIVGLGLIGGSLALALRGKCAVLYGIDPDEETLALARQKKIVDEAASTPEALLGQADLIILAAPVGVILAQLRELPGWHPGEAIVLDVGSTKTAICTAMEELPERFDAIGGHPMSGKEKTGLANASADLFREAAFAFSALGRTSGRAKQTAENLARLTGAKPVWVDPATHDLWVAATSHLPYLAACALTQTTPLEAKALVGPGFRSTTRVAETNPEVMVDILETNRIELLEAVRGFRIQLDALETDLRSGNREALRLRLQQTAAQRRLLVSET